MSNKIEIGTLFLMFHYILGPDIGGIVHAAAVRLHARDYINDIVRIMDNACNVCMTNRGPGCCWHCNNISNKPPMQYPCNIRADIFHYLLPTKSDDIFTHDIIYTVPWTYRGIGHIFVLERIDDYVEFY